jgi:hypothetical protein
MNIILLVMTSVNNAYLAHVDGDRKIRAAATSRLEMLVKGRELLRNSLRLRMRLEIKNMDKMECFFSWHTSFDDASFLRLSVIIIPPPSSSHIK